MQTRGSEQFRLSTINELAELSPFSIFENLFVPFRVAAGFPGIRKQETGRLTLEKTGRLCIPVEFRKLCSLRLNLSGVNLRSFCCTRVYLCIMQFIKYLAP